MGADADETHLMEAAFLFGQTQPWLWNYYDTRCIANLRPNADSLGRDVPGGRLSTRDCPPHSLRENCVSGGTLRIWDQSHPSKCRAGNFREQRSENFPRQRWVRDTSRNRLRTSRD